MQKLKLDLNALRVETFDAGPGGFAVGELRRDTDGLGPDCTGRDCEDLVALASDGSPRDTLCYQEEPTRCAGSCTSCDEFVAEADTIICTYRSQCYTCEDWCTGVAAIVNCTDDESGRRC